MSFAEKIQKQEKGNRTKTHRGAGPAIGNSLNPPLHQSGAGLQAKLKIGAPNDKYEKQADSVADKVVSAPASAVQATSMEKEESMQMMPAEEESMQMMPTEEENMQMMPEEEDSVQMMPDEEDSVQMMADEEENVQMMPEEEDSVQMEMEDETVQPKSDIQKNADGTSQASPDLTRQLSSSKGGGQLLPKKVQREMGSKIGADFREVKVHNNSQSAEMNNAIGAKAFTHGNDIYFNDGEYNNTSQSGKHLLAHELTHTVQQGHGQGVAKKEKSIQAQSPPTPKNPLKSAVQAVKSNSSGTGSTLLTENLVKGIIAAEAIFLKNSPMNALAEDLGLADTIGPGQLGEPAITQVDTDFTSAVTAFQTTFNAPPTGWKARATDPNWSYLYISAYLAYSINRAEKIFQPKTPTLSNADMGILEIGIALYHGGYETIKALRRRIATGKGIGPSDVTKEMVEKETREGDPTSKEQELGRYTSTAIGFFDFNFSITAALESRKFDVTDGKVRVTTLANYQNATPQDGSRAGNYKVTLYNYSYPLVKGGGRDRKLNAYTTYTYTVGSKQVAAWTGLANGEYWFTVKKNESTYSPDTLVGKGRAETIY